MPQRSIDASGGGPPVRDAMLVYASLGFSVIPILPGTKKPFGLLLPNGQWRQYQQHPATTQEINQWIDERPDTGAGVVCGEVSGKLYCLDVDDVEFSLHLEGRASELAQHGAWVVRTGSNKIHLWIHSREKVLTGHLLGGGRKLADIRGDGQGHSGPSYIVVPPTVHPSGNPYETLAGEPASIKFVSDARVLFDKLRDIFTGVIGPGASRAASDDLGDMGMADCPSEDIVMQMRSEIQADPRLSRKTKLAILDGADAGEGKWVGAESHSEVDHAVIKDLRAAGKSVEYINAVFAWSPLGAARYRNRHKGSYGRAYVEQSMRSLERQAEMAAEASKNAAGHNFVVNHVTRIGYEEPVFELTLDIIPDKRQGTVRLGIEDLMDEYRFKREVGKACHFFPMFDTQFAGRKFEKFGALILAMADVETVPETATAGGHLRATIMGFITNEASPQCPEDYRMVTLGWRDGGRALIRGGALMQRLQNAIRPAPKPDQVWGVLRGLGSEEVGHKWPSGHREMMWSVPTRDRQNGS